MKTFNKVVICIAIVFLLFRAMDWMSRKTDPLPPVPEQNGYLALVAMANSLPKPAGDLADLSTNEVVQLADKYADELGQARKFIHGDGAVPLAAQRKWSDAHQEHLSALKRLAVYLALQGRAQVLRGETNAAALSHLEVVHLSQLVCRGGILVDAINSLALETVGAAMLRAQVTQVDAATARRIVQELETVEQKRDTPDAIFERERNWANASFGLVSRIGGWFWGSTEKRKQAFAQRQNTAVGRTRKLMLLMAARTYELEKGSKPSSLQDLVPAILVKVPVDPATGAAYTALPPVN